MTGMEFRLLGPVEVLDRARALPLGGRKQRALLALLLLHSGDVVSRDRLIDELWQGRPPPSAETTLRSYLSRLRRELGSERLRRQPPGYLLALDPGELDARRFERLAGEGREALAAGRAGEAAELLRQALELWRGPVAADVASELPPQAEAGRLEALRLEALEDRIDADLELGRQGDLVGELESLLSEHRLRERLWAQLMLSLYRCERQADALAVYTRARAVLTGELGLEPSGRLQDLQQAILRHEIPAAAAAVAPPKNLPAELTSFLGREAELAELELLVRQRRLVTLTGVGGVGKSRLALEAARRAVRRFRDGVWLVELAPISDPALLPQVVSEAVGVPGNRAGPALELLRKRLGRAEALLLLDNCEHLLEASADLAEELIRTCEGVRVLATSRERLGIVGEAVYQVPPLPLPPEDADANELADCAAVRLFIERGPGTRTQIPVAADVAIVARICRELDGLPLAIELAAAHTTLRTPAEIADHLDDRFRFLQYWRRHTPARHQTLRATMDWSYDLLPSDGQQLLRRLSVFAGGFTLESAAAVCRDGDQLRALEVMGALVDASLVSVAQREGASRYRLLETVRQYASLQLAQAKEVDNLRRRHAEHFLALAESANLSAEAEGPQHHDLVIPEQDNARAAIEWATAAGEIELALRLTVALENFWVTRNPFEGMRWFERLLEGDRDLPPLLRARALRAFGSSSQIAGDNEGAQKAYEESLATFRRLDETRSIGILLHRLGMSALEVGDTSRARTLLEESLTLARHVGSRRGETQALGTLGSVEQAQGNTERATALFERSATMAAELGRTWWQATMLSNLAELALDARRPNEAEQRAKATLRLAWLIGDRRTTVYALANLGQAATMNGDARRAGRLWGAIEAEHERAPIGGWERDQTSHAKRILTPDRAKFERGRTEGRQLSLNQTIEYALKPHDRANRHLRAPG